MLTRGSNPRRRAAAAPAPVSAAAAPRGSPWRAVVRVLRVGALLALVAGLALGGQRAWAWATSTPFFALEAITVHGAERATADELSSLGGLALGMNLVSLEVGALEEALRAHPWVRQARARRRFPRTLELTVEERRPVALAALGERLYLVDVDGTPFKRLQPRDELDLPIVTGLDREAVAAARAGDLEALRLAVALLERYVESGVGGLHRLSEVHLEGGAATLTLDDGPRVLLGEVELATDDGRARLDAQLERLGRVARELRARGLTAELVRLDNRARPSWITVTPRPAAAAHDAESRGPSVQVTGGQPGARGGALGPLADAAAARGAGAVGVATGRGTRQARTGVAERPSRPRQ